MSLRTKGDNNTPLNPPLTALLTQSIPRGVGRCQVAVAKLWLTWQRGLRICCDVSQVRSGSLGSNKTDPCWGIMSKTMAMTLFVCERGGQREVTPEEVGVCEGEGEWVGWWWTGEFSPSGLLFYVCVH